MNFKSMRSAEEIAEKVGKSSGVMALSKQVACDSEEKYSLSNYSSAT